MSVPLLSKSLRRRVRLRLTPQLLLVWKSHDWDVLDRLHQSGYIHDPATKAKSVMLTEEGEARSKRLFEKHFMAE